MASQTHAERRAIQTGGLHDHRGSTLLVYSTLVILALAAGATALVWVAKLAVLGVLLYVAFWFALVMLGVAAAGWAAAANTSDEDEWPFTDLTELRKTPGYDPNLYNDTSHELYTDD